MYTKTQNFYNYLLIFRFSRNVIQSSRCEPPISKFQNFCLVLGRAPCGFSKPESHQRDSSLLCYLRCFRWGFQLMNGYNKFYLALFKKSITLGDFFVVLSIYSRLVSIVRPNSEKWQHLCISVLFSVSSIS